MLIDQNLIGYVGYLPRHWLTAKGAMVSGFILVSRTVLKHSSQDDEHYIDHYGNYE